MKKLRQEFADTMLEVGEKEPRLVVLVGDISHGILQKYAQGCPGRYFNVGICEPTIVNMAAGLAKSGLIPVVHTIAPFIVERSYEQIKLDFGYQNLSGNFITVGGAFDYSQLGCSHHCYTDVSLMSHFKRSIVVLPGSAVEFNVLFKSVYAQQTINYFKLPENPHGITFSKEQIQLGKGIQVTAGEDLTLVCIGSQLKTALEASQELVEKGIKVDLLYFHTLKPFDFALVRESVQRTKRVLVVEELSQHDGIFNLVLRACMGLNDVAYAQIAIPDFVHGYGTYAELCQGLGFSSEGIQQSIYSHFPELRGVTCV